MDEFTYLSKIFANEEKRSIHEFTSIYENIPFLRNKISQLIEEIICQNVPGKKVLIKPNWVSHSIKEEDDICLRTHDNIILALLDIVLSYKPTSVIIGDAPIQGCNWNAMLSGSFKEDIRALSDKYAIPVEIKDFRRRVFIPRENKVISDKCSLDKYVIFDLKGESELEEITAQDLNKFRVTSYDPRKLAATHKKGMHKYCISKDLFECDTVITVPKIKTHQKTGMTGALKILVGLNGDKDYLPHHRVGGCIDGGDCYPGSNILRHMAEWSVDHANQKIGHRMYKCWNILSAGLWKASFPNQYQRLDAGWYGNDTTWRMVLDINKIALFGKLDGTISRNKQREIFALSDAIIGGQGNGPLSPSPIPLGFLGFTNDFLMNDICFATLMNFNFKKLPLLLHPWEKIDQNKRTILLDSKSIDLLDIASLGIQAIPPDGWVNFIER